MTYGCYNRNKLSDTVVVQTGWKSEVRENTFTRMQVMDIIPDPMTKDCQYTLTSLGQSDAGCIGCKHRKEITNVIT